MLCFGVITVDKHILYSLYYHYHLIIILSCAYYLAIIKLILANVVPFQEDNNILASNIQDQHLRVNSVRSLSMTLL